MMTSGQLLVCCFTYSSVSGLSLSSFVTNLRFPQFLTQVFPSTLSFFSLYGESFVKGVVCPIKNKGKIKNRGDFVKGAD